VGAICILNSFARAMEISDLRIEYLTEPQGIHVESPRFSWVLESERRGARQTAYQIKVTSDGDVLWDSGKVASSQTAQVEYNGAPLKSAIVCEWSLRVWDEEDKAFDSAPAGWSMGLLEESDWQADWIGVPLPPAETGDIPAEAKAISLAPESGFFQKKLVLASPPQSARLMLAGNAHFTVHLNGRHIMVVESNEGQALWVTDYLEKGENDIKITCRGNRAKVRLMAALVIDGKTIGSDESWGGTLAEDSEVQRTWTDESRRLPARYLRREFSLNKPVKSAFLHFATGGTHEIWLNGQRVSDDVLAPGFTDFKHRIPSVAHDVTRHLKAGQNALGLILGNGRYYAPRRFVPIPTLDMGAPVIRAQLIVRYEDGTRGVFVSDPRWKANAEGPIRSNNVYDGETYDARMEFSGWSEPGFDDSPWPVATVMPRPPGVCRSTHSEPARVLGEIKPVEIKQMGPGVWRFDFGENLTGWTSLKVKGAKGTEVSLQYAARLNADGSPKIRHLRSALAKDRYILKGSAEAESWEPRFSYQSFRWVEVSGLPGKPDGSTLTAKIVGSAVPEASSFQSSDPVLNQIVENSLRTLRSNYMTVPLDCTDRDERQGWQGDRGAELRSEAYLFDIAAIYTRWLTEIRDSQAPGGEIPSVAPALWERFRASAVWPTVSTMAPRTMYLRYGDRRILEKNYDGNARWIDFMLARRDENGIFPASIYGDWCAPPTDRSQDLIKDPFKITDKAFVDNAYLALQLTLMAEAAEILGKDSTRWKQELSNIRKAIQVKWWKKDHFANGTQATFALGHSFDLVPEGSRAAFNEAFRERLEKEQGRVGTGNIGIQWLHTTLNDLQGADVPLEMATQKEYPGYGYMIDQGATTIWELWNGDTAGGNMNSANHIMMIGDFPQWCFENLAGIQPRMDGPGFAKFTLSPTLPDGLSSVSATHRTIRGQIESRWSKRDGLVMWEVKIPANTTAEIHFPAQPNLRVRESGKDIDLSDARNVGDRKAKWYPSGLYRFEWQEAE